LFVAASPESAILIVLAIGKKTITNTRTPQKNKPTEFRILSADREVIPDLGSSITLGYKAWLFSASQ
jgi:hypothetical protein